MNLKLGPSQIGLLSSEHQQLLAEASFLKRILKVHCVDFPRKETEICEYKVWDTVPEPEGNTFIFGDMSHPTQCKNRMIRG